ncbi:hypothetical protein HDU98_011449, partial [Podochytrium sp. JEL0797]
RRVDRHAPGQVFLVELASGNLHAVSFPPTVHARLFEEVRRLPAKDKLLELAAKSAANDAQSHPVLAGQSESWAVLDWMRLYGSKQAALTQYLVGWDAKLGYSCGKDMSGVVLRTVQKLFADSSNKAHALALHSLEESHGVGHYHIDGRTLSRVPNKPISSVQSLEKRDGLVWFNSALKNYFGTKLTSSQRPNNEPPSLRFDVVVPTPNNSATQKFHVYGSKITLEFSAMSPKGPFRNPGIHPITVTQINGAYAFSSGRGHHAYMAKGMAQDPAKPPKPATLAQLAKFRNIFDLLRKLNKDELVEDEEQDEGGVLSVVGVAASKEAGVKSGASLARGNASVTKDSGSGSSAGVEEDLGGDGAEDMEVDITVGRVGGGVEDVEVDAVGAVGVDQQDSGGLGSSEMSLDAKGKSVEVGESGSGSGSGSGCGHCGTASCGDCAKGDLGDPIDIVMGEKDTIIEDCFEVMHAVGREMHENPPEVFNHLTAEDFNQHDLAWHTLKSIPPSVLQLEDQIHGAIQKSGLRLEKSGTLNPVAPTALSKFSVLDVINSDVYRRIYEPEVARDAPLEDMFAASTFDLRALFAILFHDEPWFQLELLCNELSKLILSDGSKWKDMLMLSCALGGEGENVNKEQFSARIKGNVVGQCVGGQFVVYSAQRTDAGREALRVGIVGLFVGLFPPHTFARVDPVTQDFAAIRALVKRHQEAAKPGKVVGEGKGPRELTMAEIEKSKVVLVFDASGISHLKATENLHALAYYRKLQPAKQDPALHPFGDNRSLLTICAYHSLEVGEGKSRRGQNTEKIFNNADPAVLTIPMTKDEVIISQFILSAPSRLDSLVDQSAPYAKAPMFGQKISLKPSATRNLPWDFLKMLTPCFSVSSEVHVRVDVVVEEEGVAAGDAGAGDAGAGDKNAGAGAKDADVDAGGDQQFDGSLEEIRRREWSRLAGILQPISYHWNHHIRKMTDTAFSSISAVRWKDWDDVVDGLENVTHVQNKFKFGTVFGPLLGSVLLKNAANSVQGNFVSWKTNNKSKVKEGVLKLNVRSIDINVVFSGQLGKSGVFLRIRGHKDWIQPSVLDKDFSVGFLRRFALQRGGKDRDCVYVERVEIRLPSGTIRLELDHPRPIPFPTNNEKVSFAPGEFVFGFMKNVLSQSEFTVYAPLKTRYLSKDALQKLDKAGLPQLFWDVIPKPTNNSRCRGSSQETKIFWDRFAENVRDLFKDLKSDDPDRSGARNLIRLFDLEFSTWPNRGKWLEISELVRMEELGKACFEYDAMRDGPEFELLRTAKLWFQYDLYDLKAVPSEAKANAWDAGSKVVGTSVDTNRVKAEAGVGNQRDVKYLTNRMAKNDLAVGMRADADVDVAARKEEYQQLEREVEATFAEFSLAGDALRMAGAETREADKACVDALVAELE